MNSEISETFPKSFATSTPDILDITPQISSMTDAPKKRSHTKWNKETNEALIAEINAPEDVRKPYAKLGYGEKAAYWEAIAVALKSRGNMFPNESYPSSKVCNSQFDILMATHRDHHEKHQFKSGTTEDVSELASGLTEIMEEIGKVADEAAAEEEIKEGIAAEAVQQENMLKKGRVTPKSSKKAESTDAVFPTVSVTYSCYISANSLLIQISLA